MAGLIRPRGPFRRRRKRRRRLQVPSGAMIHPRIDELIDHVDSRYALVIVAAKRARQINNYHHQLGEGTFDQFLPPLIESRSKNYLTMALEEVAEGKIKYAYKK
jgi:DNA-directed RNA polymerase subunit omega